jgi:hypothetical protein
MTVRAKTRPGGNSILVDYTQRPELNVLRIKVIGKGKRVVGLQPTVIGIPSLSAASN